MKQELKQRLIGAITVTSLLVIFAPFIFDGSGYQKLLHMNLDTPAQPHVSIDQELDKLSDLGKKQVKKLYGEINLDDMRARKDDRNSGQKKTELEIWKVQVGMFSQQDNAKAYVESLRKKNYPAQYRTITKNKKKQYVVELIDSNEKQIRAFAKSLEKDRDLKNLIVKKQ